MKIYVAGPFFSDQERNDIKRMISYIQQTNPRADLFIPMEHFVPGGNARDEQGRYVMNNAEWGRRVFDMDVAGIDECDEMYVLYYGLYSDTGTAWETGYAFAKGMPITLFVPNDDINVSSLMIHNSARVVIANKLIEQK